MLKVLFRGIEWLVVLLIKVRNRDGGEYLDGKLVLIVGRVGYLGGFV